MHLTVCYVFMTILFLLNAAFGVFDWVVRWSCRLFYYCPSIAGTYWCLRKCVTDWAMQEAMAEKIPFSSGIWGQPTETTSPTPPPASSENTDSQAWWYMPLFLGCWSRQISIIWGQIGLRPEFQSSQELCSKTLLREKNRHRHQLDLEATLVPLFGQYSHGLEQRRSWQRVQPQGDLWEEGFCSVPSNSLGLRYRERQSREKHKSWKTRTS